MWILWLVTWEQERHKPIRNNFDHNFFVSYYPSVLTYVWGELSFSYCMSREFDQQNNFFHIYDFSLPSKGLELDILSALLRTGLTQVSVPISLENCLMRHKNQASINTN